MDDTRSVVLCLDFIYLFQDLECLVSSVYTYVSGLSDDDEGKENYTEDPWSMNVEKR